MLQATAWLPYIMLLVDRMVDRPKVWYASFLALVIALELYAAHAQIAYLIFVSAGLYALARLVQIRRHRVRVRRAVLGMSLAALIGILTSSAQILPAIQLFILSPRGSLGWGQANRFILWWEQLINFIFPNYYGNPAVGNYWGAGNYWEPCVFVGWAPLALAIYAVWRCRKRLAVRYYAILGLTGVWLALGKFGGLFWLAFYLVPGISSFHDPARFTFITTFSLAALAAIGMRSLRDRGVSNLLRVAIVCLTALQLGWFSARLNPSVNPKAFEYQPDLLRTISLNHEARLFVMLHETVWERFVNYDDYGPYSVQHVRHELDSMVPNIGMLYGVETANGYEPVPIRAVTEVEAEAKAAVSAQEPHAGALLGLFNATTLVLPMNTRFTAQGFTEIPTRGAKVFRIDSAFPRAWLVRSTHHVEGRKRELSAITDPNFNPAITAIVSGDNARDMDDLATVGQVTVSSFATHTNIVADAGESPAFLVWSAACYPGWVARSDGIPIPIVRTNHAFTGVYLTSGKHDIVFEYKPFVLRIALYLSFLGIAAIFFGLGSGSVYRSHSRNRRATAV